MLKNFISKEQLNVINQALKGQEKSFFEEKMQELELLIQTMPKPYETDGQGNEAIAQLHYFYGGSDWYITERDSSEEQIQCFGYVVLNQDMENAELGYISIQELIYSGVELDLHWTPKTLREIRNQQNQKPRGTIDGSYYNSSTDPANID